MTTPDPNATPEGAPPAGDAPKPGEQAPPPKTFTQEDFNKFEARTKREYREKAERDAELIELGKTAKEALDAKRPLEERVTTVSTELATTQRERDEVKAENRRYKLAATAKLDPLLWDRVRGTTEEEILADIETLKPLNSVQQQADSPPAGGQRRLPQPNPQQGNPSPGGGKVGSTQAGRDLYNQRHGIKQDAAT